MDKMLYNLMCIMMVVGLPSSTFAEDPTSSQPWSEKLFEALTARDDIIDRVAVLRQNVTRQNLQALLESLSVIPTKIADLDNVDETFIEYNLTIMDGLLHQTTKPIANRFIRSINLERDYNREMSEILRAFQGHHNFRCFEALYSPPESLQGFAYPIDYMCYKAESKLREQNDLTFSADKICQTVKQCTGVDTPYPYDEITEETSEVSNVEDACTGEENHCDVKKAVPMMSGLLWYKVSKYMARSLCRKSLNFPEESRLDDELKDIKDMVKTIMGFTSTLAWQLFFEEAMDQRAYTNLDVALRLMNQYEKSFSSASLACHQLDSAQSCTYSDINVEYQAIRTLQQLRLYPETTRNLRLFERVNQAKVVALHRDALDHLDILGNIRSVDENLGEATNKMKAYFTKLAQYDQGIADQDVAFIVGKLDEFSNNSTTISEKLQDDMTALLQATITILSIDLGEQITLLALQVAENMNFIKAIFGGVEVGEMLEQASNIVHSAANLGRAASLFDNLHLLLQGHKDLVDKFRDNFEQITGLQTLIAAVKNNTLDRIESDMDEFIAAYGSYTPMVDRSDISKNDALWGAFQTTACDLLYGVEGSIASAAVTPISGMLMCEKLESTIAEYTILIENIFDFQFDLVDALARVVRGQTAKKMAEAIKNPNQPIPATDLMLGYFKIHTRLQTAASLYCDKLEYLNQGETIPVCNPSDGLFSRNSLNDLIAYKPDTTYHVDERFVYIPTRPQFPGDQGFISLYTLKGQQSAIFRLPNNQTWLKMYNWLGNDKDIVPFLQSFKLYLPYKSYAQGQVNRPFVKTRVSLISTGSSAVGKGDIAYNLPPEHSQYLNAYSEGFNPSRCPSGSQITNPYSLCGNLPDICDSLTRVAGTSLLSTIISTWQLNYTMETATEDFEWDAPDPATNLLLIAKVKLKFPSLQSSKRAEITNTDDPIPGCCTGNEYRSLWNDKTCKACPDKSKVGIDSTARLGGYYCEKEEITTTRQ